MFVRILRESPGGEKWQRDVPPALSLTGVLDLEVGRHVEVFVGCTDED